MGLTAVSSVIHNKHGNYCSYCKLGRIMHHAFKRFLPGEKSRGSDRPRNTSLRRSPRASFEEKLRKMAGLFHQHDGALCFVARANFAGHRIDKHRPDHLHWQRQKGRDHTAAVCVRSFCDARAKRVGPGRSAGNARLCSRAQDAQFHRTPGTDERGANHIPR
jgi:hypothetical protein